MNSSMVFITVSQIKIMTAQHILSEAGIESVVLDQMDSAHAGVFGDIKLFVPKDDELRAKELLVAGGVLEGLV